MAKIINRSGLNVGTELLINETDKTIELVEAGNLDAKDGVTVQALYSKLNDLWATPEYQDSEFPMNAIDALSGQFIFGQDAAGNSNGWTLLDDSTRNILRDGGWQEYNAAGTLTRVYTAVVGLGVVSDGAALYYQTELNGPATDFVFLDQANQAVLVFDSATGFDNRDYFKAFVREQGKLYSDSVLSDTGRNGTGAFVTNMLLQNQDDLVITADDSEMNSAPYDAITVEYFDVPVQRDVGGTDFDYDVVIAGNGASLEQIYTKVQYLLRQSDSINEGDAVVIGQTADLLLNFVGETLETTTGVYIDNIREADSNRVVFQDTSGTNRINPFVSAGELSFNDIMVGAGSSYRLMYVTGPDGDDDFGQSGAITVNDADGNPITGTIASGTIPFTFDFDNDDAGGVAGTPKNVVLIGINPGSSKYAVTRGVISSSKALTFSLVAEQDRAYL